MPLTTYTIHEGPGLEIVAEVDYDVIPATGDGWNEPREPAYVDFKATKLIKRERRLEAINGGPGTLPAYRDVWRETDLGPAPKWISDVIDNDDTWTDDILADEYTLPDADSYRDDLINRELMDR